VFLGIVLICSQTAATMCSVVAADHVLVAPQKYATAWACQFGTLAYAMQEVRHADVVRIICIEAKGP